MRVKEKFNKKLLVEGNDDQHVVWALCEKFKVMEAFDVIDCEGIESLSEQIPIRFKQSGIITLGIIIDADTEIKKRWISLKDILSNQGFKVPNDLPTKGLVLTKEDAFKVGVWIMPDNNLNGMLEDFISFLIPNESKLLTVANETLNSIEQKNLNEYSTIHKSKALIHSWLSWQKDPGTPMGLAITKKYLSIEGDKCLLFIDWLKNTFQ
jgi:hypothetical protein